MTDIPTDAESLKPVMELSRSGVEVYWIDHHPWANVTVSEIKAVCTNVVYNESTATPAGVLLGRWLGSEDPYCDRLGRICYTI